MKLRCASLLLALSLPLLGNAQTSGMPPAGELIVDSRLVPELPAALLTPDTQVVPVWSDANGRLVALVDFSNTGSLASRWSATTASGIAADWRLIDVSNLLSGGLRWQSPQGLHVDALFSQQSWSRNACIGAGSDCLFSTAPAPASAGWMQGSLGLGWTSGSGSGALDLSYGLSWLRSTEPSVPWGSPPSAVYGDGLADLIRSQSGLYQLDSADGVVANARMRLGDGTLLDLGAGLGRSRLTPFGGAPSTLALPGLDLQETSLSLAISSGSLRGSIIGRTAVSPDPLLTGKRWTTFDFGVSWRTPWQGELSLGTQSQLTPVIDANGRDAEATQNRVPYVQYRQDL